MFRLDSVFELHTFHHLAKLSKSAQEPPAQMPSLNSMHSISRRLRQPLQHLAWCRIVANVRLDRVGRADALPVRGGKAVEGHQLVAILRQLLDCLRILLAIGVDEAFERRLGIIPGLKPSRSAAVPAWPEAGRFRVRVERSECCPSCAAGSAGGGCPDTPGPRGPEPQRPAADRHQGAQLDILGPKPAADPVRPDAGPAAIGQILSAPPVHLPAPLRGQARHARG